MNLIEWFVRNPVKVSVGVILVALFGTIALYKMPMQLTPEVEVPTITVTTMWPGASPQEIESEIIQPQEEQLQSVEGLQKMSSESSDSRGQITLEFAVGTPSSDALLNVSTRLQQVREYPENADEPVVATSNIADRFIAWFILTPQKPSEAKLEEAITKYPDLKGELEQVKRAHNPGLAIYRMRELAEKHPEVRDLLPADMDVTKLRRFCRDFIETRLERVDGVSNANVMGGREEELQVVVDPHLLASRQLTIGDVREALRKQNKDTSGGDFWEGKRRYVIRTLGQFKSEEQVANVIISSRDGNPVYVRDVAKVRLGYKKPDGLVHRYGTSVIAINAQRETGSNVLQVMEGLRESVKKLNETVLKQRGLELTQVYDETEYIYSAVNVVNDDILQGAVLTLIVLLVFLRSLRSSLVVLLAIATSVIGMFLMLGILGRTLNVLTLAGISFAVGMLVDNFIVVMESIFRHHHEGENVLTATVKGTKEVWGAIVASTLANLAVFLPVLFVQDQVGQLFRDLALAVSCSLALSLLVALVLIPTAASRLIGGEADPDKSSRWPTALTSLFGLLPLLDKFGDVFVRTVVGLNATMLRSVTVRLVAMAIFLGVPIYISYLLMPKVEYLPNGNRNLVIGILVPPPGYNLEHMETLGHRIEESARRYWDIDLDDPTNKDLPHPMISDFFYVVRGRQLFMGVRAVDPLQGHRLVKLVQEIVTGIPGTFGIVKQSSLFERGLTSGRSIDVEITGPDIKQLVGFGGRIMGQVSQILPQAQALPIPSLDLSSPEVHVNPRWEQAAELGLSADEIGYAVNALVDGAYATDYFIGGDKIDLSIVGREDTAQRTQDLESLPISTRTGRVVSLGAVADLPLSSGPEQINRRERQRAITIQVSPPPEMALEDAMQKIQKEIITPLENDPEFRGLYQIGLSGTADKLRTTWLAIRWNMALAILITYLVMAALFESWLYPLLNMILKSSGHVQPLDMLTMVGFIILVGTVVNNPILIVEQALVHIREDGMAPHAAILESVRTRIRPIFMTALIGLFGLLPLVISPGAGSELYRGLGSVTLGGLIASTVFTLFLVPVSFSLAMDSKAALARLILRRPAVALSQPLPAESKPAPSLTHLDEPAHASRSRQQEPVS
ncbi:MAG: hydrophobic/amphiphilic exporter-1 (mainly G- bacteria) HAE1 family [Planctomycetota bacterium]|nr:MAG: hydrophobic/amphiphilic exporter-1 (mainly G- bacteria) HAE1 family [Planctomycetota bacterium]